MNPHILLPREEWYMQGYSLVGFSHVVYIAGSSENEAFDEELGECFFFFLYSFISSLVFTIYMSENCN